MEQTDKLAILGAGNMGGAVALGLHRFAPEYALTVTTAHSATLEKYAALGIDTTLDNVSAIFAETKAPRRCSTTYTSVRSTWQTALFQSTFIAIHAHASASARA